MIELDRYDIFKERKKSLKELSIDDSDPENIQYMTDSEIKAIDFDKVKDFYESNLELIGGVASSVDAISHTQDSIVFIEFKNGNMKNEKAKVKVKIRDSLLIFGDITDKTISYTREKVEFVLVYNEDKNPLPNQYTRDIPFSPSRMFISKQIAQLGKTEFVLFDLEKFKKLYFKDVHTYSQEEFKEYAMKLIE